MDFLTGWLVAGVHLVVGDVGELFKRAGKVDESSSDDSWEHGKASVENRIKPPLESEDSPDNMDGDTKAG